MDEKTLYNDNWHVIQIDKKRLWCLNVLTSKQLLVTYDLPEVIRFILRTARKPIKKYDLAVKTSKKFGLALREARKIINNLYSYGLLVPDYLTISRKVLKDLYPLVDRNLKFFSEITKAPEKILNFQKRFTKAKICILGMGSIGTWTLATLLSLGARNFKIVDFDIVEKRNLFRQLFYFSNDIGKLKIECIKKNIHMIDKKCNIKTKNKKLSSIEDVKEVIKDVDFVIQACDSPRFLIRRWIREACVELGKPHIMVHSAMIGPLVIPKKSADNKDVEEIVRKNYKFYDKLVEAISSSPYHRPMPYTGVITSLSAVFAASETFKFITKYTRPLTIDAVIVLDLFSAFPRIVKIR